MSDPAVEAAERVLESVRPFGGIGKVGEALVIAAAREALKPIRALHVKGLIEISDQYICNADGYEWPCNTAKLIYQESELP